MRARGMATEVRGAAVETARLGRRRPAALGCGDGGRERGRERPTVPQQSTFRRVAVFVPFR